MKIDIIISAADIKEEKIKDKIVVIIDTLRATSVMVTAVSNGCSGIIPVKSVEEARRIAQENKGECLLGGERSALKIEGFDLSNSPLEYKRSIVEGKLVIMTTTNGTQAIKNCCGAERILIGSMINGQAIADKLVEINKDVVIVNAGTYGQFSKDDFITAGYIISRMKETENSDDILLTDIAETSLDVYNSHKDIKSFLEDAEHYRRLVKIGFLDDLKYCLQKDLVHIVPEYKEGYVK